jgi:hypothetical protein
MGAANVQGEDPQMKIGNVHSHMGGLEFIQVHWPAVWAEIESAVAATHDRRHRSAARMKAEIGKALADRGWKSGRPQDSGLAKNRVSIKIQFRRQHHCIYDLLANHLARYIGKVIDVGVVILPMKSLQEEMSSGVGYYEAELYNLIREGRGVPAVPLVLIGVKP